MPFLNEMQKLLLHSLLNIWVDLLLEFPSLCSAITSRYVDSFMFRAFNDSVMRIYMHGYVHNQIDGQARGVILYL